MLVTKLVRSIERGIGPSVLKDAFEVEELKAVFQDLLGEEDNLLEHDIVRPEYLAFLGCWWFARGIEASAAKRRDVRISDEKNEVSWN